MAFAAAEVARAMADGPRLARAALLLADLGAPVAPGLVDDAVLALYEEATAAVGDQPSATRARLLSATAVELQWGPDSTRRIHLADEALAMARVAGDNATLTAVLAGNWAAVDGRGGRSPTVGSRSTRSWRVAAKATGDPRDLHYALRGSIGTFCCLGEVDAARRHLTTVDQLADRLRLPRFRFGKLVLHAMIDAVVGDLDRAETHVMEGIAVGQAADLPEGTFMGAAGALLYAIRTAQGPPRRAGARPRRPGGVTAGRPRLAGGPRRCPGSGGAARGGTGAVRLVDRRRLCPDPSGCRVPRDPLRAGPDVPVAPR